MGIGKRQWLLGLIALGAMSALCGLAYARALSLPFISDDYIQIALARAYGPISGWSRLAHVPLYRCRATSLVLTYWTERFFGLNPVAFNWSSLILHIFNTWLVFALGCWRFIGWRSSAVAACFFAIYQGHQEAVIWYAALPELLVFFFAVASLLFWILWLQSAGSRGTCYYAASLACFVLALLSKESAVVVTPLLAVTAWVDRGGLRARLPRIAPFAALALAYFSLIFASQAHHLHFHDGTFSLYAPFWIVVPRSVARLLWIWGAASLAALAWWRARRWIPLALVSAVWIVLTLLPYSFLTYMPYVPSRHTYFASVGLAFLVAAGFLTFQERFQARRWAVCLLAALIMTHHSVYLWTKKQQQFLGRAAPTEELLVYGRGKKGPIYIECFPYDISVAQTAMEFRFGNRVYPVLVRQGPTPPAHALNLCSVPGEDSGPPPP